MIRLFAALVPPLEITEALIARQSGLAGAAWRPLEALHITLRFFGEIAETAADDLDAELARVGGAPLTLELAGVGSFADGADIHAVWAGVAEIRPCANSPAAARRRPGAPASNPTPAHIART